MGNLLLWAQIWGESCRSVNGTRKTKAWHLSLTSKIIQKHSQEKIKVTAAVKIEVAEPPQQPPPAAVAIETANSARKWSATTMYSLSKYTYMKKPLPIHSFPFSCPPHHSQNLHTSQKKQSSLLQQQQNKTEGQRTEGEWERKSHQHLQHKQLTIFRLLQPFAYTKQPALNWLLPCKTLLKWRERERKPLLKE